MSSQNSEVFDLRLTREQLEIRETVRDFVRREIEPIALERDRLENFDERCTAAPAQTTSLTAMQVRTGAAERQ